ncbi:uncharacterized protein LOC106171590 [Lingula anatina]|uniref:Uncharacterized protein LOC106171590 n=1 Tax=Lingula anatina TaxID=7574 RepID=A0A1S3JAN2_LINAN|nr:uncharacterized protein LOC106171590 [Lingula anatina]|eukprot:XP_013407465.1 uncharacterized protein LOC106171590 [Lingula anatina]
MDEEIVILHFNDVYNIQSRTAEPVGGAARMVSLFKSLRHLDPLVVFSGDCLNPSLMSSVTEGKQMIPVLKALNVDCAVYGNHDFDFGIDDLEEVAAETGFPWLISNVVDNFTEKPLASGLVTHVIEHKGKKLGFLGLVEEEWLATLATLDKDDLTYTDYVDAGRQLATDLRDQGVDIVIALTHMRWPNDIRLAENVDEIDLILGGHDHDFGVQQINGKYVIKSGTDFRQAGKVTLHLGDHLDVRVEELTVDSSIEEDQEMKEVVDEFVARLDKEMDMVLGHIKVPLDGRFSSVRTRESNLGNFVADIMLTVTDAHVALINSGTFRSDVLHPAGEFTVRDLVSILPLNDPLVVLKVTGRQLIEALENGVSQYPKLEGRFPQVGGVRFAFDPRKPAGQRVDWTLVKVQEEPLELDKDYRVCVKVYLSQGKDGFDVFKDCPMLADDEGPVLATAVQNYFTSVQVVEGKKPCKSIHRASLFSVIKRKSISVDMSHFPEHDTPANVIRQLSRQDSLDDHSPVVNVATISSKPRAHPSRASLVRQASIHDSIGIRSQISLVRQASIQEMELEHLEEFLAPKVEGRIILINSDEHYQALLRECHSHANLPHTVHRASTPIPEDSEESLEPEENNNVET